MSNVRVSDTVMLTAEGVEHVEQYVHIADAECWTGAMEGEVERVVGEVAWIRFPVRMEPSDGELVDPYLWDMAGEEFVVVKEEA